jgi:Domain of unknown function (DUF5916)/Carbohydrate family 9 binding domain-like
MTVLPAVLRGCGAALVGAALAAPAVAQEAATASHRPRAAVLQAVRVSKPPVIDGQLNDEAWSLAAPAGGFTQQDPDEGRPATEATDIRIVFDDSAIYIGARMFDRDARQIARRLSSRDVDPDADFIAVFLDPMHDHQNGAMFRVSAANVQKDAILYNDTWRDDTWDAVWQSAVSIDAEGWSAELRIPLSQLRFPAAQHQTWGFNASRFIRRNNETSWLELVLKNQSGMASRMAHLTGLDGLRPKQHLELLPYAAVRSEFVAPADRTDPFNDGARAFASAGLDAKYGVTSNLTLDATVNPDFGQVEVDPAVINLSAFETFFPEKRPFFLEGAQIFDNFGRNGANDFWGFNSSEPIIFYSRRIGRVPQIDPTADFVDAPTATTILGAAKLTGRTPTGWNLGLLDAITAREFARTATGLERTRSEVEPFTNYFAGRAARDIGRRTNVGLIATAVTRSLDTPAAENALPDHAFVGGADGYWFLGDGRDWVVTGKVVASHVEGSRAAMATLQEAAQRYFQRPDAPHVSFDPDRTSLSGYFSRLNLNRNSGSLRLNAAVWGVSPGFEANDAGFMTMGDRGGAHTVLFWRKTVPDRFTRARNVWVAKWYTWNFGRQLQGDGAITNGWMLFHNYWETYGGVGVRRRTQDDRLTRGGPSATAPAGGDWRIAMNTDWRSPVSWTVNTSRSWDEAGGWNSNTNVTVNIKPSARLTINTGPQLMRSRTVAQYVTSTTDATAAATYGGRYVFGRLAQTQLSFTTRATVVLSRNISIQVYAQPLLAEGNYTHFGELAAPRTFTFRTYGIGDSGIAFDPHTNIYTVSPDGAMLAPSFTFTNPDFNTKSLRVNAVLRWELKPGSTFYAVWTRQQEDDRYPGEFKAGRDAGALFSAPGNDVFMVKMAYWIGR